MKKRFLSVLLCLVLVVGLLPTAAFAEGSDTDKAIRLGTSGISDPTKTTVADRGNYYAPNSYVYFGVNSGDNNTPIKWRVLDADKANDGTTSGMFLLSEYLLASGVYFNSDSSKGNVYQGSDAQTWCSTFATNISNFSTAEQGAMLGVAKTDSAESNLYSMSWDESSLTADGDKLFFLSVRELADYVGNYNTALGLLATDTAQSAGGWWLRSPYAYNTDFAGAVYDYGLVYDFHVHIVWAARPAFNLNLNSVLFTSAAVGGKSASGMDSGLTAVEDYDGSEWKLTLLDSGRTFNAATTAYDDTAKIVTVAYSGAVTGTNEYISALVKDSTGEVTYYGRLKNVSADTDASGIVELDISGKLNDGDTLYIFNEQYNGEKKTDYASELVPVHLTSFTAQKTDGSNNPLAGATFELQNRSTSYYAVSDKKGNAVFSGIAPGTYTLSESEAPFGYIKSSDEYEVIVDPTANDGKVFSVTKTSGGTGEAGGIIEIPGAGNDPGVPANPTYDKYADGETIATFVNAMDERVEIQLPVSKTVELGGAVAPGAETFTFELLIGTGEDDEGNPVYQLVDKAELATNAGTETTRGTLTFEIPESLNTVDSFSQHEFYLREKQGAAAGWSYSTELYRVERYTDNETQHYRYSFTLQNQGQTESTETASFTNTYTGMTYEIPFTKTVKLGGNTSPGQETFQLEIFDPGNSNLEDYDDLYTAAVTTNGSGDFEGKLVISGPAEKVDALISEGFYVREKEGSAENWTYSNAVWYVSPDWTDADNGGKELAFSLCPATLKESDNGSYYVLSENPADKMSFENVYTRNTSGGGGGYTGVTITANKTDTQGKALSGATFVLEDSRGREAYTATSNSSGVVRFTGVGSGTYTLLEKSAPDGYVSSGDSYEITVSGSRVTMNGKTYSPVTFVNKRAAELNRTDHYAFLVGYVDGTFGPERNMTRAEVTTMFARLLTEQIDANKTYTNTFTDVPSSHWASDYIGYMQQFGIITGYADGSFRPDAPVTRAEFAVIASRFEKLTEGTKSFTDVTGTYWAAKYINFAATRGWVTGYSDGTFKPENNITRAEVAAVTCRLLERSADQNYIRSHLSELRTFRDMSESHWAYWYAMEAANGHDYTKNGKSETWSRTHN